MRGAVLVAVAVLSSGCGLFVTRQDFDVVKAQAKEMTIRVDTTRADESTLTRMADVLSQSKGMIPVRLHMALAGGAEVTLSLGKDFRVEVSDPLFSGLERIFGEQVAELR